MTYKRASYIALGILFVVGIAYLWHAIGLTDARARDAIGPAYFPTVLGVLLLVLCAASFLKTLRSSDERVVTIPNAGLVALSVVLAGLFIAAWQYLSAIFYPVVFALCLILMTLFSRAGGWKRHAVNVGATAALTVGIYLLFDLVMQVRF
ncbi:tripartite tricarboxylate transporter TctB family protein [Pararhizobium haloflavum]|uniref:tripartite tricarboxylate transporter TctB family protein n=1 Tax=Pararhizobium haloflavum TaxID=2037914 RepID=UPI000C197C4D|nr:tripartite tricarboxylate transporter TctB family protein [Pararhizobium haloflavum]